MLLASEEVLNFLRTIRNDPENDAPRLILADWLEEHDCADHAELIRVQCESRKLGVFGSAEAELIIRAQERWQELLSDRFRPTLFTRGLLFIEIDPDARTPFEEALQALGESGLSAWISTIEFGSLQYGFYSPEPSGNEVVDRLSTFPYLLNLRALHLGNSGLDADAAHVLANTRHFSELRVMLLENNSLGFLGAAALLKSPYLKNLRVLNLRGNGITTTDSVREKFRERYGDRFWLGLESPT